MIIDSHIHSTASTDSKMKPESAVEAAKRKGIGITFTEHYDADYVVNDYDFRVNPDKYITEYAKYRSSDVFVGIEIGLTHMSKEINKRIACGYPFDYVIGSVHMVGETDIYLDFNKPGEDGSPVITCGEYLDYVLEMITGNDFFDALGHIDYPHRYIGSFNLDFSYKTHKKKYDTVLKSLIERDIPIEVNSRRLSEYKAYKELYEIYESYYRQGGRYVTLGSDSHNTKDIGRSFNEALKLINGIGLVPVYFKERKRHEIKL